RAGAGLAGRAAAARPGLRSGGGGPMIAERAVVVINQAGIHARPSSEIVKTAAKFSSSVTLSLDGLDVNAKSIMGVMMLAAPCGSTVKVRADGDDAEAAVTAMADLFASRFGEA
ncbi:MAG: HPr family phosphocarrier protein, partial [Gemmatimonadota bacterium]|nr:HPr family phosphocarrier protein [Gemmatimonadota bacterium]